MANDDVLSPENLASILRNLKLSAIKLSDVEWMYAYSAALPLLNSIQKVLRSGEECLIPQDSSDASCTAKDLFAPILLALPSIGARTSSSRLLTTSLRAAQWRLKALQLQRMQIEELASPDGASMNQNLQTSVDLRHFSAKASNEGEALSNMRHAIDHAKHVIGRAAAIARADATALNRVVPEFLGCERQLRDFARKFESGSQKMGGHAYEYHGAFRESTELKGNYRAAVVELFAEGCASVEEERVEAIANLARATAWYQSLRQYRRQEHQETAGISRISLNRSVREAFSRWNRQLSQEVCPLASANSCDNVRARARTRKLEVQRMHQRDMIADTRTANRILALQHLRLKTIAEVLRIKIGALRSACTGIAATFPYKGPERPKFDRCLGVPVNEVSALGEDCSAVTANVSANAMVAHHARPALRDVASYPLSSRLRRAGLLFDKSVIGALSRTLYDFCRSVRGDKKGIALHKTELFTNGVRDLQGSVIEAGELLDNLLKYYNQREGSARSNTVPCVWTGFFAPRHPRERLEYLISLR
jgi:hypothetical protein